MKINFKILILILITGLLKSEEKKIYLSGDTYFNTTNFVGNYMTLKIGTKINFKWIDLDFGAGAGIPMNSYKNKDFQNYNQQLRDVKIASLGISKYFDISDKFSFITGFRYDFINFSNGDIYIDDVNSIRNKGNNFFHNLTLEVGIPFEEYLEIIFFYSLSINEIKPFENLNNSYRLNVIGIGLKTFLFQK